MRTGRGEWHENTHAQKSLTKMAEYATGDGYIAALIAAQRRQRDREDPTRRGCPLPPNPTIGKDENIQGADPQPPPYDTLDIPPRVPPKVPVTSELNENLLWQVVENDLRRNVNVDDPLKGARRLGRKLITAMYFPLLNDGVRFIWSLLQVIILVAIIVLQFLVAFKYGKGTETLPCYNTSILVNCSVTTNKTADTAEILSLPMGALAIVIALIDCIACTSYFLHRKCCKHLQTAPEEQPLLGVRVRWARLSAVANWWHKYSDIPRFKVFEALYVVICYLAFASRNDNIPLSITVVAGSLFGATLLLQAAIFVRVAYSTYYQRHHSISYRATGLLWAFVVHFTTYLLYLVLLLAFSSYIYDHYGIPPTPYGDGERDGVSLAVLALVCGYLIVPLFSHLTFFTMLYGWFKYAYTKTFADFFNYLNNLRLNSISLQERESIKFVLDKYHYEALITPPCTWNKAVSYIPGCVQMMVLGLLLTLQLSSLSVTLAGISYAANFFHRVDLLFSFLALTLLFHIVYIAAAIVWPFYLFIDLLGWCCY